MDVMLYLPHLYFILVIVGLFLVGAEVFVPGGILGIMGGVALLIAMIIAFPAFNDPTLGIVSALAILFLVGVSIVLWIKIFPKTRMGKRMTISMDLHDSKATEDDLPALLQKTGETLSELRPSGFALIAGRRTDVVTEGEMISKGEKIIVVEVEGNRVVVAKND